MECEIGAGCACVFFLIDMRRPRPRCATPHIDTTHHTPHTTRVPRVTRATQGPRVWGGTESFYGLWFSLVRLGFGSVWDGVLGGIARVRLSHRESTSPEDPFPLLNSRAELEKSGPCQIPCWQKKKRSKTVLWHSPFYCHVT